MSRNSAIKKDRRVAGLYLRRTYIEDALDNPIAMAEIHRWAVASR